MVGVVMGKQMVYICTCQHKRGKQIKMTNRKWRQLLQIDSNNDQNPNKNICVYRVAKMLGVEDKVRYLHTISDLKRAARTRFSIRSVKSIAKAETVGAARKNLNGQNGALGYIVWVPGHVLLLGREGRTIVDTDPRKRDRRKIKGIYGVYRKA